jgi:hypothetical protein
MAEGDGVIYNGFKEYLMEKVYNLATGGDAIKLTLHTSYTPNIDTHDVWADTGVSSTEYGTASGYTAGGKTLGTQDVTLDTANDRAKLDAADATWTALGALSPATPGHAILWDDTPTSPADPLILYWELGLTATNGGDYTLAFGANGIVLLT